MAAGPLARWCEISMPFSCNASTASGFSRPGSEPALKNRYPSGAMARARPSAIWLRAEFATHRNRIVGTPLPPLVALRGPVFRVVLDRLAFDQKDDVFGNVGSEIGDPLEVAAHEQ